MHPSRKRDIEKRVLESMVTLASLSTAAEVSHAIRQRKRGFDPSTQEAHPVAAAFLEEALLELRELLVRLRLIHATENDEPDLARLVRAFDRAMLVKRCSALLQTIHQRLLSLYPGVSEDAIERARTLYGIFARINEQEFAPETQIHHHIDTAMELCIQVDDCLR